MTARKQPPKKGGLDDLVKLSESRDLELVEFSDDRTGREFAFQTRRPPAKVIADAAKQARELDGGDHTFYCRVFRYMMDINDTGQPTLERVESVITDSGGFSGPLATVLLYRAGLTATIEEAKSKVPFSK